MRAQAIEMADFRVSWTVVRDSERTFQRIVLVTERSGKHGTGFKRKEALRSKFDEAGSCAVGDTA